MGTDFGKPNSWDSTTKDNVEYRLKIGYLDSGSALRTLIC